MRLENRNLYVTGAELSRIAELKDDADALARHLGPEVLYRDPSMSLGLVPILLSTAPLPGYGGSAA